MSKQKQKTVVIKSNLTEEILSITAGSDRGSYAKPLFVRALSSHSRVRESELSSWINFFQSCRQGSNRGPSDKKATAKSTPPRGTHIDKCKDNGRNIINFLQADYPNYPGSGHKTIVEIAHEENINNLKLLGLE